MKNILCVGCAGYLGGAVVDEFLKHGDYNIKVFDSLLYEETYRKPVPFVFGDIRNHEKLKKQLDWADAVIWLSALVGDQACEIDKPLAKEINADSLQFLVDNFKGRIIFSSTCSIYGASEEISDENSEPNPLSHYARTKLMAEKILQGVNANALILRLGTLYGVSNHFSRIRSDLVVNTLVLHAKAKNKITVFGGNQYRPIIHVKDVAKVIYDNINSSATGIYNITADNVKIIDLAKIVEKFFPGLEMEVTDTKFEDNRNYKVNNVKAINGLNFNPTIRIETGIAELKKLLDEKRIKNPFDNRYSNYKHLQDFLKGE